MAKSVNKGTVLLWILVLGVCFFLMSPLAEQLEAKFGLGQLMRWRGVEAPPAEISVIAINEDTAEILGKPEIMTEWSRQVYADLVQRLQVLGVKTIVFDIFFSRALDEQGDYNFANAIKNHGGVILLAYAERSIHPFSAELVAEMDRIIEPLLIFQQSAYSTAPFILPKVPAQVSSFMTEYAVYPPRKTIPTVALEVSEPTRWASFAKISQNRIWYNFYGPPKTIMTVPFEEILTNALEILPDLKGSTVFVGYSSNFQPEQLDGFQTAFTSEGGHDISGVELAATAFANLRDDVYSRKGSVLLWPLVCLIYAFLGYWLVNLTKRYTLPWLLSLAVAYVLVTFLFFRLQTLWLPWLIPVFGLTPVLAVYGYHRRLHRLLVLRKTLESAFGRYIPSTEIDRLIKNPQMEIAGETLFGVCMATDAQGYTTVAEKLSPVKLGELMQKYLAVIIDPIRESGGIISDVAGDGVIAVWPHLSRESAYLAIHPVIKAIQDGVEQFNLSHSNTPLPTRIGVHAGELVLGHFGAADHFEYRAIGDIVNTASRIEGANKNLGTKVLISEDCLSHSVISSVAESDLRYVGKFIFKGKHVPIGLHTAEIEAKGISRAKQLDCAKQYAEAIRDLELGEIVLARNKFVTLGCIFPHDGPTQFFVKKLTAEPKVKYRDFEGTYITENE